ncbi:MAG: hypothetical protein IJ518_06845 [Clostridia bacterium]|nr:hypothetical protein [Clostridia bacterium]
MKKAKKLLAVFAALCLLMGMVVATVSADATEMEFNSAVVPTMGTTTITVSDENIVSVMEFIPGESGIFRFSLTGAGCTLYTVYGSQFFMFNPQAVAGNTFELEIKESVANSPMLVGVAGNGTAKLTITRVGDASFDVNALPFETYETTETLTKFTFEGDKAELVYVDVTESHTAVLGSDGYYHLDSATGPLLYMNFVIDTYVPVASAAANGVMKDTIYDEDGNFVEKIEFITCINEYYGYTNNATNQWVPGYTDGGLYPLTADIVYIMQTHTNNSGWGDINSVDYLFGDVVVDPDTAWMFPMCYVPGSGEEPVEEGTADNPYELICNGEWQMVILLGESDAWFKADNADGSLVAIAASDGGEEPLLEGYSVQYGLLNRYFPDATGAVSFTMSADNDMFFVSNTGTEPIIVVAALVSGEGGEVIPEGAGTMDYGTGELLPGNGTMNKPFVLDDTYDMSPGDASSDYFVLMTDFEGSEEDGYYHTYVAPADGFVDVWIDTVSTVSPWQYAVSNETAGVYGDTHWSDDDPLMDMETVAVREGDEITVWVATYNADNMWEYPAGRVEWFLSFSPAGSFEHPEVIEGAGGFTTETEDGGLYVYSFTALADGKLTITMNEGEWFYALLDIEAEDESGIFGPYTHADAEAQSTFTLDLIEGQTMMILVASYDAETDETIAGTVNWTLEFEGAPGSIVNPIIFTGLENEITVPAGATMYYTARFTGLEGTLTGGDAMLVENETLYTTEDGTLTFLVTGGDSFQWPVFIVTNTGDEETTYQLNFNYPLGSRENPIVLDDISEIVYEQVQGDEDGVYYVWTATSTGKLQMSIKELAEGSVGEIVLGGIKWLNVDGVDGVLSFDVVEGDEVSISLSIGEDAAGNRYPGETMVVTGNVVTDGDDNNTGDNNQPSGGDDNQPSGGDNTTGDDETDKKPGDSPVTGETGYAALAAVLAAACAGMLSVLKKRTAR